MNSKIPNISISSSSPVNFLFYMLFIYVSFPSVLASENETDYHALLKVKSMMITYGSLSSWNDSLHYCEWVGVTCGRRHRRVTNLVLESQGLKGSLSPHIGNLSFLRELSLFNNSFQGSIPHEVGRLFRLRDINLSLNNFSGVIPANISGCSNLQKIRLSRNNFHGNIPKEISFLSKLTKLSLHYNNLTGGIPSFLGNITSMEIFSITGNPLVGSIPNTLGQWKNLKEIYSGNCNLTGAIPSSIYNLSLLTYLSLPENQLTGSVPPTICVMLPQLVEIQLRANELHGPLPSSISNCSRLQIFEMAYNFFSGKLTIDFSKLTNISFLSIGDNNFGSNEADEMNFMNSLKNCSMLKTLDLSRCNFQGMLPRSLGNLSNQLQYIYMEQNQLHGNLPESIGNLVGLNTLYLFENQLVGSIPSTIGNLQSLGVFYLNENRVSGHIPDAMGNLSSLLSLDLSNNFLEGAIPSSLGNCNRLLELHLNENKLNGKIPTQIFQLSSLTIVLDLSRNNLYGLFPSEVGVLNMLSALVLSDNNLSGNIPSSLGDCASLSGLFLNGNLFQGMIPQSLSFLKGLAVLDVSHNNLSGQIPHFFVRYMLEYLNLSYNDFEGEVPTSGVFANTSVFSILGNSRLCGGLVELGLPKCKEINKHQKKFPLFVIVILVGSTFFTLTCLVYVWCKKITKRKPSQQLTSERFMKVSYNQLRNATNGFSDANLVGKGRFGLVYKGILEDNDKFVAIKVLNLHYPGAERSFNRECKAWRSIRHRNLLKIITSCSSIDFQGNVFKALVYEFMSSGSLHDWLHLSQNASRLNLIQILNILIDVASALDYMHNHCVPSVVHGDLKPSNILLDEYMVAHVGDYGLTRFLETLHQNSSTQTRGTIGYVAPEYGIGNEMTSSGDVYSFGILLLEALTGKKPTDDIFNEGLSLHKFAFVALPDHVTEVIDVNILNAETFMQNKDKNVKKVEECLVSTVMIGVSCSVDSPSQRMNMENVANELQHIRDTLQNT